jgi:hypothetical protein
MLHCISPEVAHREIFLQRKTRPLSGRADIEQASPRSIWPKLPTRFSGYRGELEELIGDQGAVWRRAWRLFTAIRVFQRHCRRGGRRMGLPLLIAPKSPLPGRAMGVLQIVR